MIQVSYNFSSDTAGTDLASVAAETGGPWAKNSGASSGSIVTTASHTIRGNFNGTSVYVAGPSLTDATIEADLVYKSNSSGACALMLRASASALTYNMCFLNPNSNQMSVFVVSNGSNAASYGPFSYAFATGNTYHVTFTWVGTNFAIWINGTLVGSGSDGNITGTGDSAVYFNTVNTDTTGVHLTNIIASTTTANAVTDANVFFSPYAWESDGAGAMQANNVHGSSTLARTSNPGAYLKFGVNAVANGFVSLDLDTSLLSGITAVNCPVLIYSVDGGTLTTAQIVYQASGTYRVPLAAGLSAGLHSLWVAFKSINSSSALAMGDRWNTPASVVKITGIEIDGKGSVSSPPKLRPKNMIVYGDSHTEGQDATATGSAQSVGDNDSTLTYAFLLAEANNAEVGIVAWCGQGWFSGYNYGNVPQFASTWDHYRSGVSRLIGGVLSPSPDFASVMLGRNDATNGASDASVTATITTFLTNFRTAATNAKLQVWVPPDGSKRSAITAGLAGVQDSKILMVDPDANSEVLNSTFHACIQSGGGLTNDGIHFNQRGHAYYGTFGIQLAASFMGASTMLASEVLGNGKILLTAGLGPNQIAPDGTGKVTTNNPTIIRPVTVND